MIRNYIKIAWRNLLRNKLFSIINIGGLAISMSVCLITIVVIADAFTYDDFHPYTERTYRVISDVTADNGLHQRWATSPSPLAYKLKDFPFVEQTVRVYPVITNEVRFGQKKINLQGSFTEPSFFDVFGFKLSTGNEQTALQKPFNLILRESKANLLFPGGEAVGKIVKLENYDADFMITGIIKDGYKTAFSNDLYISFATISALEKQKKIDPVLADWKKYAAAATYVVLKANTPVTSLNTALNSIATTNGKLFPIKNISQLKYDYQRLDKITPGEELIYGGYAISASFLWMISGIVFLILLLACFNYTNLSVARSLTRAREVGVRKVLGGSKKQLFLQFIFEALLTALIALFLAVILLQLLSGLPIIRDKLLGGIRPDLSLMIWFIPFAFFTGLLAGTLPAWILSAFKPADSFKGIVSVRLFKKFKLHKTLIGLQFSVSLLFIIFLVTIYRQTNYQKDFPYGFNQENIINLRITEKNSDVLKAQIQKIPGVERISATSNILGFHSTDYSQLKINKTKDGIGTDSYFVDENFLANMGLKLVAGTNLPAANFSKEAYILLNEKAVKSLRLNNPHQAIGKLVWLNDSTQVQVAGVVNNFNFMNLKHELGNLALRHNPEQLNYLNIKVTGQSRNTVESALKSTWKKLYGSNPISYNWFDVQLKEAQEYKEDFLMVTFLAIMAITISCMGLLGIVTYSADVKQKEVGIRKVMGAGVKTLLLLLSKDFVLLLLITSLFTLPLGYMVSNAFLNQFAYRVSAGFEILFTAVLIIMLVGLLIIIPKTLKAALANPVKSLRTE